MKDRKIPGTQRTGQVSNPANQPRASLSWSSLEQQVVRMQKQISQASQSGDKRAVHDLQQRLMESEAARLLAVRRVAEENQGKNTAGVDGVKSLTPHERLAMASAIHPKHWNQQPSRPVRRVWVPKPGTAERRPLAILTMMDRCKQALVKLALEPEWEAQFEPHSYGYRPGRSAHDAIAAILVAIERQPCFVFDADIEGAFDNLNQAVVLDKLQTFPALRHAINAWLTAGAIDGNTYFPSETGIAQGGVLSPLLMNVALHGMEAVVRNEEILRFAQNDRNVAQNNRGEQDDRERPLVRGDGGILRFAQNDNKGRNDSNSQGREQPLLVRYADDFVILHTDLKELQRVVKRVRQWLATMGLHLHAHKTRITHTMTPYQGRVGFDFLGFHIRQEQIENSTVMLSAAKGLARGREMLRYAQHDKGALRVTGRTRSARGQERSLGIKTIIAPSQEANKRHLAAIDQRLQQLQTAPQAQVIAELNPLILGWANYYAGVVDAPVMGRYDDLLEQRLINWASRRHPGKAGDWLLAHYWHRTGQRRMVFATDDGIQLRGYWQRRILGG